MGLSDTDPGVRSEAATTVSWHSQGHLLIPELQAHFKDQAAEVRSAVARSLGVLDHKASMPELRALLKDGDAEVRFESLRALRRLDSEATKTMVEVQALVNDPDKRIARAASRLVFSP